MNPYTPTPASPRHRAIRRRAIRHRLAIALLAAVLLCCSVPRAAAQRVALKTNTLEWAALTPNLGAEFMLSDRLSLEVTAAASPYRLAKHFYHKQARIQPELKYWLQNLLYRHYIGFTAFYSSYDIGLRHKATTGDAYAAGFTYGYHWMLSSRWNLEVAAGIGAVHYRRARYTPGEPKPQPHETGWTVAPVKLGVSFVYVIH